MVEVEEFEASEEEELERWTLLRGTNIRAASPSVLMVLKFSESPAVHPLLGGDATQVIEDSLKVQIPGRAGRVWVGKLRQSFCDQICPAYATRSDEVE